MDVPSSVPSIRELMALYEQYHLPTIKDSRTAHGVIRREFAPLFPHPLTLPRLVLVAWYNAISQKSRTTANRARSILRTAYQKAIEWGVYDGPNPTDFLKPHVMQPRGRIIEEHEMPRVMETILWQPLPLQTALLTILTTDSRPGEVQNMRWDSLRFWTEVSTNKDEPVKWCGSWDKGRTKNGLTQVIPIPSMVAERLRQLPQHSPWVFPGYDHHQRRKKPGPMSYAAFHKQWQRVARLANIPDVTPHDLRRTGCTYMLNNNENLMLVSKGIMNHTNVQTTRLYFNPFQRTVKEVMDRQAERLMGFRAQGGPYGGSNDPRGRAAG